MFLMPTANFQVTSKTKHIAIAYTDISKLKLKPNGLPLNGSSFLSNQRIIKSADDTTSKVYEESLTGMLKAFHKDNLK